MTPALTVDPVRPYPHIGGQSRRFKAEPTKLTGLSARVMCASGNFTTRSRPARSPSGLFFGAVVMFLTAGTLALAGDTRPADPHARVAGTQLALSDHMFSLGVGEFMAPAEAEAPRTLDAQDRFEIDRLFRLTAAASQALAPAAGPPRRGRQNAAR